MFDLFYIVPLYTLGVAILAVRRGELMPWLWIILFTGPLGATIYLLFHLGGLMPRSLADRRLAPRAQLERARADAVRLDSAGAWSELGAAAYDRRRFAEAAEAARRTLAKSPGDFEATYLLGRALLATNRAAEARAPLAAVVAKRPEQSNGEALFALARACRLSGDLPAARAHLEQLGGRSSRADFLHELAAVELESGDRAAARTTLQRIVDESVFVPRFMKARVRPWVWRARWRLARLGTP